MNIFSVDLPIGTTVVLMDGRKFQLRNGFGMVHANVGKALYGNMIAEDGSITERYQRLDGMIDRAKTEAYWDQNNCGPGVIQLRPTAQEIADTTSMVGVDQDAEPEEKDQDHESNIEDWELEGRLEHLCSDATTDVMSEDRCIEILIQSMDAKSQREAYKRIQAEMQEDQDDFEEVKSIFIESQVGNPNK